MTVEIKDFPLLMAEIHSLKEALVAAIDDFNTAIQAFTTELASDLQKLSDATTAELARVTAALGTSTDPAVMTATASLQAATTTMKTGIQSAVDALNSELPAPPPTP